MANVFENVHHNKAFPATVFVTQISQCAFHWHYDYEIILVLKGTVTVYCGSEPTMLSSGDLFLFNTKTVHGIQHTTEDNLLLVLQFDPSLLENSLDLKQFYHHFYLNSSNPMYPPSLPYQHFRKALARLVLSNQSDTDTTALRTYSLLLTFLADIIEHVQYDIRRTELSENENTTNEFCSSILDYIDHNLQSENLSQELCRNFGMSEKSLYRYLKSTLGLSFKELYDIVRIEKACTLLRENKKTIAYIWEMCAFSSEVSFYRNFKKQMGVTPKEYRDGGTEPKETTPDGESYVCFNLGETNDILHRCLTDSE